MNTFALIKDGKIANVVQTPRTADKVQEMYPGYEITNWDDVPHEVQLGYKP